MADGPSQRPENGPARDPKGRILPGSGGALRGGRKKGAVGFAKHIRRQTENGRELVRLALEIARDPDNKRQMDAIDYLTERMLGKAPQTVEVSGPDGDPIESRAEVMSVGPEKLEQVLGVLARAGVLPAGQDADGSPARDEAEVERDP